MYKLLNRDWDAKSSNKCSLCISQALTITFSIFYHTLSVFILSRFFSFLLKFCLLKLLVPLVKLRLNPKSWRNIAFLSRLVVSRNRKYRFPNFFDRYWAVHIDSLCSVRFNPDSIINFSLMSSFPVLSSLEISLTPQKIHFRSSDIAFFYFE